MKPILFNTESVKAILDGRKSVTRRVVKPQPTIYGFLETHWNWSKVKSSYQRGDAMYVREAFREFCGILYGWENGTYIPLDDFEEYQYRADNACFIAKGINPFCDLFEDQMNDIRYGKWHPSIHMPKEAARLFLRVTGVRVERLQNIDNAGARAEGCDGRSEEPQDGGLSDWQKQYDFSVEKFQSVWDSTIKKADLAIYGWAANPWVWVIEFKRISKEEVCEGCIVGRRVNR